MKHKRKLLPKNAAKSEFTYPNKMFSQATDEKG